MIVGLAAGVDNKCGFTLSGVNLTAGMLQVVSSKGLVAVGLPAGLNVQMARLGDPWFKLPSACKSIKVPTPKLAGAQPLPGDAFPSGFLCAKCKK